jgi:uncharacterized protein YbjT (DUF2867 family)
VNIVVIGGNGLIGSKVVGKLREHGHEVVPASPKFGRQHPHRRGTNGGAERSFGALDVSISDSFEEAAAMDFFTTATGNLLRYDLIADV